MKKFATAIMAGVAMSFALAAVAEAKDKVIGVSWANFQEERWKTDEAAMKSAIEAAGNKYISADAQSSAAKQLTDVESLIAQGANALIILSQDASAIGPAVEKAINEGIPVVGYDRLIENKDVFYLTFDNKEVGRMQARAVFAAKPEGNYAFIKGSSADPNADFLFSGQMEVLKEAMDAGKIKNVGEAYTDGWLPANAQKNMEQILTANNNAVDAVVASNDGTAGGVVAALAAQGLAGTVPVSGQDGDHAALNRIALGTQTVTVFKDARELGKAAAEIATALADGKKFEEIPNVVDFTTPGGNVTKSLFLKPVPITKDNLNVVIDAGWVAKDVVCQGVSSGTIAACGGTPPSDFVERQAIDICFASDREKLDTSPERIEFSYKRSENLTLGFSQISIPKNRDFGDTGRPSWWELVLINIGISSEDPEKHFIIQSVRDFSESDFVSFSERILKNSVEYKNTILLFVHGFSVTFDESLYTTAQIAVDMNFDGLPCTYSWPSMGKETLTGYNYDSYSARQTRNRLSDFLKILSSIKGADSISIVAHSMGSAALIEALRQHTEPNGSDTKPYSEIVLAAPDMDRDDFRSLSSKLSQFARGVTLYASSHDKALLLSKSLAAGIARAGDVGDEGPVVVADVDTIDASTVSDYVFGWNHSYYANDRTVLTDIATLLQHGARPPMRRNPTLRSVNGSTGSYWKFP